MRRGACPHRPRPPQDVFLVGFLESEVDALRGVATAVNAAGGVVRRLLLSAPADAFPV